MSIWIEEKMEKSKNQTKSDAAIARKWTLWPIIFGCFVGISLTKDVFDKVTKPHSIIDELALGALFSGMYAAALGGITFVTVFFFLKIKRLIFRSDKGSASQ